jgi:hypothetical protein
MRKHRGFSFLVSFGKSGGLKLEAYNNFFRLVFYFLSITVCLFDHDSLIGEILEENELLKKG